jgi:hypothetical protein
MPLRGAATNVLVICAPAGGARVFSRCSTWRLGPVTGQGGRGQATTAFAWASNGFAPTLKL